MTSTADILDLVVGRQGHFGLESGHHSRRWLELGSLFADPHAIERFVAGMPLEDMAAATPYAGEA